MYFNTNPITYMDQGYTYHKNNKSLLHNENGDKEWYTNGKLHRIGGPAIERANGHKEYWINGLRHREDGPAIEYANGDKQWWINGQLHRIDGPAVEHASGYKEWFFYGLCHREDGPAVEYTNGDKEWWVNNKRHRTDGPAVEYAGEDKEWWIEGKKQMLNLKQITNLVPGTRVNLKVGSQSIGATVITNLDGIIEYHLDPPPANMSISLHYASSSLERIAARFVGAANSQLPRYYRGDYRSNYIPVQIDKVLNYANVTKVDPKTLKVGDNVVIAQSTGLPVQAIVAHISSYTGKVTFYIPSEEDRRIINAHNSIELDAKDYISQNLAIDPGSKGYYWRLSDHDCVILKNNGSVGFNIFRAQPRMETMQIPPNVEKFIEALSLELRETIAAEKKLIEAETKILNKVSENLHNKNSKKEVTSQTFSSMFKSDLKIAGYRITTLQLTKAVKKAIIAAFKDKEDSASKLEMIAELLDSEFGSAFVSSFLGYVFTYMPKINENIHVQKLAEEFRVNGMAIVGNEIISSIVSSILPSAMNSLSETIKSASESHAEKESEKYEEEEEEELVKPALQFSVV